MQKETVDWYLHRYARSLTGSGRYCLLPSSARPSHWALLPSTSTSARQSRHLYVLNLVPKRAEFLAFLPLSGCPGFSLNFTMDVETRGWVPVNLMQSACPYRVQATTSPLASQLALSACWFSGENPKRPVDSLCYQFGFLFFF